MTTNPAPSITPIFAALDLDDPRRAFGRAVAVAAATIAAVRPEQLADPTPCPEFTVEGMLAHLVSVPRRVATVARGDSLLTVEEPTGVAPEAWTSLWAEAVRDVEPAWTADDRLTTMMDLPWAELPGAIALRIFVNEVSVHTWDLAQGTGQRPVWDDDVLRVALETMQFGLPADGRGGEVPFGPVVDVPADAPLIDRLVGWNGRRPA